MAADFSVRVGIVTVGTEAVCKAEDAPLEIVATEPFAPDSLLTTADLPDSVSLLSRCKSLRISAADWQRSFLSFSNALLMTSSSFDGTSGFERTGGTGAR
jgi:hypothetical protein